MSEEEVPVLEDEALSFEPGPDYEQIEEDSESSADFVDKLKSKRHSMDAVHTLCRRLSIEQAVGWASASIEELNGPLLDEAEQKLLSIAKEWGESPDWIPVDRLTSIAEPLPMTSPVKLLALATDFSEYSKPEMEEKDVAQHFAACSVLMAIVLKRKNISSAELNLEIEKKNAPPVIDQIKEGAATLSETKDKLLGVKSQVDGIGDKLKAPATAMNVPGMPDVQVPGGDVSMPSTRLKRGRQRYQKRKISYWG